MPSAFVAVVPISPLVNRTGPEQLVLLLLLLLLLMFPDRGFLNLTRAPLKIGALGEPTYFVTEWIAQTVYPRCRHCRTSQLYKKRPQKKLRERATGRAQNVLI
jgi:hypothetical protein